MFLEGFEFNREESELTRVTVERRETPPPLYRFP